jgi:putative colanic acid biosynthesis acetyltransferase WcaF
MMQDLYHYHEEKPHRMKQLLWRVVNKTLFRCLMDRGWLFTILKNSLLNAFGAKVVMKTKICRTCTIWAPWNLEMKEYSVIGPHVQVYNKDKITIGRNVVVSQGAFLCTASHDISHELLPLTTAPIVLEDRCWVAADAFIGKGVTVGEGAVVGARACVYKDVDPWTVVGGNPAQKLKNRIIQHN